MDQAKHAQECFLDLQHGLEHKLLTVDPTISVSKDSWQRKEGGGGRTWAVSEGKVIEKGGINFSDVCGEELPPTATQNRPELAGSKFRAMGVSVVFHPLSPHVPTAHANVRYFEASPKTKKKFGGLGVDLILHLIIQFTKMLFLGTEKPKQPVNHLVQNYTLSSKIGVMNTLPYRIEKKPVV